MLRKTRQKARYLVLSGNSKQSYPPFGWGFLRVSRTASWQDSDSKESA